MSTFSTAEHFMGVTSRVFSRLVHRKCTQIKAIVLVALEKEYESIAIVECCINIIWYSTPVAQLHRKYRFDGRLFGRVKVPKLISFEKENLSWPTPLHDRVDIVRNSRKGIIYIFRVATV